jgi:hypothetical protein
VDAACFTNNITKIQNKKTREVTMATCGSCGTQYADGKQFCPRCGSAQNQSGTISKCINGHNFDRAKHASCPYCPQLGKTIAVPNQNLPNAGGGKGKTVVVGMGGGPSPAAPRQRTVPVGHPQAGGGGFQPPPAQSSGSGNRKGTMFFSEEMKSQAQGQNQVVSQPPGKVAEKEARFGHSPLLGFLVSYNYMSDQYGAFWPLRMGKNTIGSSTDNTIVIDLPTVSREHAQIIFRPNANWVEDRGAQNGIEINHEMMGRVHDNLCHGDTIQIGPVTFTVVFIPKE